MSFLLPLLHVCQFLFYFSVFPLSLASEIRKFSDFLRQWMEIALKGLPESLQEAKYKGIIVSVTLAVSVIV